MNKKIHICPITYEIIPSNQLYSSKGLRKLSPTLKNLNPLPFTTEQQIIAARRNADKMSIQGVQPKLSARLDVKNQTFILCENGGNYILKPQNNSYSQLPENEDLTMHLAASITNVPLHGLLYCIDGSFTYFIKRFDRGSFGNKIPLEDFAQLAELNRDTKYEFLMEKIIPIIDKFCTFPMVEKIRLFKRILFNYLIGNEDMHLKNYSLIFNQDKIELSPAYDFINTTIAIGINHVREEIALPINGKKNNLTRKDLINYYGKVRLNMKDETIDKILTDFNKSIPKWFELIEHSFLNNDNKNDYIKIIEKRRQVLKV